KNVFRGGWQFRGRAVPQRPVPSQGQFYDYPIGPRAPPLFQNPPPPFWSGAGSPEGGEAAGRSGFNLVANAPTSQVRAITDRDRGAFKPAGRDGPPLLGLARFVIMDDTDEAALTIARRAYPLWHRHFHHLFRMHGVAPHSGERPPHFDQIKDGGRGIAG